MKQCRCFACHWKAWRIHKGTSWRANGCELCCLVRSELKRLTPGEAKCVLLRV